MIRRIIAPALITLSVAGSVGTVATVAATSTSGAVVASAPAYLYRG